MKKLSRRSFIKLCSGTAASLGLVGSVAAVARLRGEQLPPNGQPFPPAGSFLSFDEITLFDHRGFRGLHNFGLHGPRTEIIGSNGSGKSTIAELLASCGSTASGTANVHVRVSPEGCEGLLNHHRELIHVGNEYDFRTRMLERLSVDQAMAKLEENAIVYFRRLVRNADSLLGRHDLFEILRGGCTGSGDQVAAAYAFLFAERDRVNYRLPLVLDDPFSSMDIPLQQAFSALVSPMETQVIMLTTEHHLRNSGWPSQTLPDGIPGLHMTDLPAHKPRMNAHELRRALHLSGSRNRHFLA